MKVLVTQLCPTLCNPPGSSVRGILQARILQRAAIPFSWGSSLPKNQTSVFCIAERFFTIYQHVVCGEHFARCSEYLEVQRLQDKWIHAVVALRGKVLLSEALRLVLASGCRESSGSKRVLERLEDHAIGLGQVALSQLVS